MPLHLILLVLAWLVGFGLGPFGFYLAGAGILLVELVLWRLELVRLPALRPFRLGIAPGARVGPLPSYADLRHAVDMGLHSGRGFDFGLRTHLRRIAAARLWERHGVDLYREPGPARALLGERLWSLLDPARPVNADRTGGAVPLSHLEEHVERLDRL